MSYDANLTRLSARFLQVLTPPEHRYSVPFTDPDFLAKIPSSCQCPVFIGASPETIPDLRAQSRAVLDSRAPDPKVTESAHDVARKVILLLDTAEGLPADSSLGLLGSGLDALASLAKPIDDVVTAQGNLISVCSEVTGTASPSPSVTAA